ncbi:MFS pantothenate transporter [Colletotrichum lupini]|uniref:MFS pantothenate transporter n=1 Tax=Colletotrichum lupini TaxID=145971 RepID=A0A9Q8SN71_9PEZI|nr:MFS pantothenate transporter [Colletotrichum lupini]UQC79547.1 MFS pantothenate transporter [Colletotrichum lupini]
MGFFSSLRKHFKGASTPLERKLVLKLDFFILTFCCLAYFMNYLDRASITQAYVSGMREDLGFKGAQLTVVTTLYATAYLIGIVPNNLLLTYFKPRNFFPFMITTWAGITMLNAVAKTPQHLMAIRIFQGYFESCIFAGTQYILGSWYTKKELGQRTGFFTASGLAGDIWGRRWLSGYYVSFTAIANAAIILAPTSTAAKFGAYYWAGSIYCIQATFFAWANDSMRNESPRLRSADDAPEFKKGMIVMIAVGTTMAIWVTVLILVEKRRAKTELQVIEAVVEEQSLGSEGPTKLDSAKLDNQVSDVKPTLH